MMLTKVLNQFSKLFLHHQTFAGYVEPVMQVFKPAWRAGQYRAQVMKTSVLPADFFDLHIKPSQSWPMHIAGQHISLTVEMNGRLLTRVFTIASSPEFFKQTGTLRLLIKTNEQGRFTGLLDKQLNPGSWCNISAPSGDFVFNSKNDSANLDTPVIFIAGGSGITPMLAMLEQHLTAFSVQPVSLIYYAKKSEHQAVEQLEKLAKTFTNFSFSLLTRNQEPDVTKFIKTADKPDVYCCGPAQFMQSVNAFCSENQLTYYQEAFGLTLPKSSSQTSGASQELNVSFNGQAHTVHANDVLLPQFEKKQLPVKRGCGIGICHQCQCVKKSGVVMNLKTGERSDNGEQIIQLCVSQPVTDLELEL